MSDALAGWERDDIVRHLRASRVFGDLQQASLEKLAACAAIETARAGSDIIVEGANGDAAFIVIAGRVEVIATGQDGEGHVVNELGAGAVVGEMALITAEPRSATVRATRDVALMRIPADDFRSIVLDEPEALMGVTRTIVRRLEESIHERRPPVSRRVYAVIPVADGDGHSVFTREFVRQLPFGSVEVVTADDVRGAVGDDVRDADVAQYLHRVEDANDAVVLVGDPADEVWSNRCRRQSDVSLIVGDRSTLEGADKERITPECHLVVLHQADEPEGTAQLLRRIGCKRHHHVRAGSVADVARVARIVSRTSTGVVLGGGGARGLAHIGVLRALLEAQVPIDHIGGTSIGATVASGLALGWDVPRMIDQMRRVTVDDGGMVDVTFPSVSLAQGKRLGAVLREGYGDRDIEDLWTDFFSVSADLTAGEARVHSSGSLWTAVRASVAVPGVFPPIDAGDGHLLVDGGVLDNVPTSPMRDLHTPLRIIAVDLQTASTFAIADLPDDGAVSGWRVLRNRLAPWRQRPDVPRLAETLIAASVVSGSTSAGDADAVIRPDVSEFGFMEFAAIDRIVDVGYESTLEALDRNPEAFG